MLRPIKGRLEGFEQGQLLNLMLMLHNCALTACIDHV